MIKKTFSIIALLAIVFSIHADEGMWIPLLLKKYNEKDMQDKGMKLTAEDIYSINHSSLKDAIVLFGRGCTGEIVSDQGLLLTNHHCGFGQIQSHSSVEHDYLKDGFWAMNKNEELPNPGLSVQFLVYIEDVTDTINSFLKDNMTEMERASAINRATRAIINKATDGNSYEAAVIPFFEGNQYFLFVKEVYTDVRLVGAPPSSIGKFGGDTDNWMWPRHTGDFSVFRVYADKDNKPADYSLDNQPYKPKKHFKISLKGINEGDFTMVYGYPYTTNEYLPSVAVEYIQNTDHPIRIKARTKRLDIIDREMKNSDEVRIKYASKQAGIANGWKKWQGVIKGLKNFNAIEKKKKLEADFTKWVNADAARKEKYGTILNDFEVMYNTMEPYKTWEIYFYENFWSIEVCRFSQAFTNLTEIDENTSNELLADVIEKLKKQTKSHFKDYYAPIDQEVMARLLEMFYEYYKDQPKEFMPAIFEKIKNDFDNDFDAYAADVFKKSILVNEKKLNKFLDKFSYKKLDKLLNDPVFELNDAFIEIYRNYYGRIKSFDAALESIERQYMAALMEFQSDKVFYPNANATLRVAYGKVEGYTNLDGVKYDYYTTLSGVIRKGEMGVYDYVVPEKLKELFKSKDFGQYKDAKGYMPVCFLASNHTSGGNSGSPVLDGEGNLIGINFDRNWEGTMSDIMYDPSICRNISLDIRYCLFVIDKFAGAGHLVEEMEIVK